jgi:hypothetical protein
VDPALEKGVAPDNGVALLPDGTYLQAYLAGIPWADRISNSTYTPHLNRGIITTAASLKLAFL